MLNSEGFDLWADGYDRSVGLSDEENSYPFAGYKRVLGGIYAVIRSSGAQRVLDIGCGTGTLAARLDADGVEVTGMDFSRKMLSAVREKAPGVRLIEWDFSSGLPDEVKAGDMDAVVCTYAIHHLPDDEKGRLIREMAGCVRPGGRILIGDIAFETANERESCRRAAGDDWDEDELYMAMDEMEAHLTGLTYEYRQVSLCAGILEAMPPA